MRIDKLHIKNFKGFEERTFSFNPSFNLVVGVNGSGKTSLLDALRVALGGWHFALKVGAVEHRRNINKNEIRLKTFEQGERLNLELQYPTSITATGLVIGKEITWTRKRERDRYDNIGELFNKKFVVDIVESVQSGSNIILPLIVCYDVARHWYIPKESDFDDSQRFSGYQESFNTKLLAYRINNWLYRAEYRAFSENKPIDSAGKEFKQAIISCLDGAKRLYYDGDRKQIVVQFEDGHAVPYENLSDGQRSILTFVGDIARRTMIINPGLGGNAIKETPGVVLIDELDQHLHPRWQRSIIDSLKRTFPKVQFIATTHSPQMIGQTRAEEIILLDASKYTHPDQSYGMDSNWILRHIMDGNDRDPAVAAQLDAVFEDIEEARFEDAANAITELRAKIGPHPDLVEAEVLISRYTRFSDEEGS